MGHNLDNNLLTTPILLRRLALEADEGPFWTLVAGSNGETFARLLTKPISPPMPEQQMFAYDMLWELNEHLHHDGAWFVGFTHPLDPVIPLIASRHYSRFYFLWIDRDGDPQFTLENDENFSLVLEAGPDEWMEHAEDSWQQWHLLMRKVLAPSDHQTFKRALGETAPSIKM